MGKGAGRPRIPDAIKAVKGTLKPGRINHDSMKPIIIEGVPEPPVFLGAEGVNEWNRVCEGLDRLRMLSRTDLNVLGAMCYEWEMYLFCREEQRGKGSYYEVKDDEGSLKIVRAHPAHANGNNHLKNYLELSREFGLTPASRSRINAPKADSGAPKADKTKIGGLIKKAQ